MANGSDIAGSAFRLPQSQPVPQQQQQGAPGGGQAPFVPFEPQQGLLTGVAEEQQYFDQLQDLNSYVENSIARGVDPTRPDLSEPDSILANRIFRDKLKRTQQLANKLKYLGDLQKQRTQLEMSGQILPGTQPPTQESIGRRAPEAPTVQQVGSTLPTKLLPAVDQYNRAFAGKPVKKSELQKADQEMKKAAMAVEAEVQRMAEMGMYTPEALEQYKARNLEALKPAVEKTEFRPTAFGQKREQFKGLIKQRDKIIKFAQAGNKWAGEKFVDREYQGTVIGDAKFNPETQAWEFYEIITPDTPPFLIGSVPKDDVGTLNTILDSRRDASETITIEEYEDGLHKGWGWEGDVPDAPKPGEKVLDEDKLQSDFEYVTSKGEGNESEASALLEGIPGVNNPKYSDRWFATDEIVYTDDNGKTVSIKLDESGKKALRKLMSKHPKYTTTAGRPPNVQPKPKPY